MTNQENQGMEQKPIGEIKVTKQGKMDHTGRQRYNVSLKFTNGIQLPVYSYFDTKKATKTITKNINNILQYIPQLLNNK